MKFGPVHMSRFGLLRGESAVASIGAAVALILVAAVAACGFWLVRTHRDAAEAARLREVETVADLLAATTEPILVADRTAVRRQVMAAATRYGLSRCRIVTAAGDTLADNQPSHINADATSAAFAPTAATDGTAVTSGSVVVKRAVHVPGRGWAELEVVATLVPGSSPWEAQAGVGAIGVLSLMTLLLVYRFHRSKLMAVGAVREALLDMRRGETSEAALQVAGNLGAEAEQWNSMLGEQQRLRRLAAVQQSKQSLGGGKGAASTDAGHGGADLAGGCDAMPQGLVMIDDALQVRYANHAAALFLKHPRETMAGVSIDALLTDATLQRALKDAVATGRRATHLVDKRSEGGGVLRFIIRPVRRGDTSSAMLVIEDVTQQRVAEESRHEFVAHATHELRAPLTNIRLYLEELLEDGLDPAHRAKSLNVINGETRRLERMISDLLSVAEIEAGSLKLHKDDVDLMQALRDLEQDFAAQAAEKKLEFAVEMPPKLPLVQADRDKLTMAIQNVVGNAIKYTPSGGRVTVTAEAGKQGVSIDVRDTGIGIRPEEHEKVFEKFYRANDKRIAGITGSGLGLALAREVMRLHGGDIALDSQVNGGSTFTITVPLGTAA